MARKRTGLTKQGEITRNKIVAFAEIHFARNGFSATRLEDISEDVGIRTATLIYYFRSKQDLYNEVDRRIFEEAENIASSYMKNKVGHLEKVIAIVDAWLDFLSARPSAARIYQRNLAGNSINPHPPEFSGMGQRRLTDIVATGSASGNFKQVEPSHLLYVIGGAIITFVCMESWSDGVVSTGAMQSFRQTLHGVAASMLLDLKAFPEDLDERQI